MIEENLAIVARRWPEVLDWLDPFRERGEDTDIVVDVADGPSPALVVDGIQLASAFAPREEAELQARLVPDHARTATVYGLGQGNVPRALLARDAIERVRVVLLSRAAVKAALNFVELFDWLDDERVELVPVREGEGLEVPFATNPASLRLADPDGWPVRDWILRELATPFLTRRLGARSAEWDENIAANARLLAEEEHVGTLFDSHPGALVRVAGAGPTLGDQFARLASADAPLIAVDAAVKPLLAAGVVPDIVVSMDACRVSMARLFDFTPEEAALLARTTLVWFPVVPHELVSAWPGPRRFALGASERYAELRAKFDGAELWSSGSVIHPAVDLARRMGARAIEFVGADFATPNGRSHVAGAAIERTEPSDGARPRVLDGNGAPVLSMRNLVSYLRDVEAYIERHPKVEFRNTSRAGAFIRGARYEGDAHAA